MIEALQYPFFQRALLAGVLASIACGIVGSYVVVKRMASISGGLSHAAFGGVGLGYLFGFSPLLGATGFTLACGIGIGIGYQRSRASLDTMVAVIWPVGMALGILFVSLAPGYAPDLMTYLFGSILFVPAEYVRVVALYDVLIAGVVAIGFKELQAISFDEEQAELMGLPVPLLFQLLMAMISLAVVTLIQVVGVILAIALLTIPAAIARQWSNSLVKMMIAASFVGAICTTSGLILSYWFSSALELNVPTGPLIILLAFVLYGVSASARAMFFSE